MPSTSQVLTALDCQRNQTTAWKKAEGVPEMQCFSEPLMKPWHAHSDLPVADCVPVKLPPEMQYTFSKLMLT